jgi:hypothetical protein
VDFRFTLQLSSRHFVRASSRLRHGAPHTMKRQPLKASDRGTTIAAPGTSRMISFPNDRRHGQIASAQTHQRGHSSA